MRPVVVVIIVVAIVWGVDQVAHCGRWGGKRRGRYLIAGCGLCEGYQGGRGEEDEEAKKGVLVMVRWEWLCR